MAKPAASGPHEYWYEGELYGVRFRGMIMRPDVQAMRDVMRAVSEVYPRTYLLVDMQACTGIDAEARRFLATWSQEGGGGLEAATIHGVGFAMRALITLTLNAIKLLGHLSTEIQFTKDEADARQWVAEHRARTAAGG